MQYDCPSPDCGGNPFLEKHYFFLTKYSDQRKLVFGHRKKSFAKKIGTKSWTKLQIKSVKICRL
jgi:hypothetical protein